MTDRAAERFKGMGLVLVVDAVAGQKMLGVEMFADGAARRFYASSLVARRNREVMAYPGGKVPARVRVVWRDNNKAVPGPNGEGGIYYGGAVVGDYTIAVATRIPDTVIDDIRSHGGALRLKFRLDRAGVLFGWDIERPGGGVSRFEAPGGDFLETRY